MKKYLRRKVNALKYGVRFDRPAPGNGQVFAKTRPGEPMGSTRSLLWAEFLQTIGEFVKRSESYFDSSSGQLPGYDAGNLSVTANAFPKRSLSANALHARHLPGSRRPAPTFHNNADDSISCKGLVTTLGESVYLTGKRKWVGRMLAGDAAST